MVQEAKRLRDENSQMLGLEGEQVSHRRLHRIYCEAGLALRCMWPCPGTAIEKSLDLVPTHVSVESETVQLRVE